MVRTSSKSSKQTVASSVPVTAPASLPVENVVVAKQTKSKKAPVVAAPVVVAPVESAAAPVESPAVVSAAPVESVESSTSVKMTEFSAKLQQLSSIFTTFKSEYKVLEKLVQRELKAAQKSSAKKTKRSGNRQPSGFVKPTRISDELAQFLGKEAGIEMARTTVSREINQYIRTNNLQDKANGRKINPDASLSTLLKYNSGDELTYFNLQKYMKHHFIKAESAVVAAVSSSV